jgi:hypothetical protein
MPRLLDLCCRIGGAGMGYIRAGYDVTGVDIVDCSAQYPGSFVQGDALEYLAAHGHEYDFIHASFPCQAHSTLTKGTRRGLARHIDLLPAGIPLLKASGRPWVAENVMASPLRCDLMLCGEMFGLSVIRHRKFQFSNTALAPVIKHVKHRGRVAGWRHGEWFAGPYYAVYGDGGGKGSVAEWQAAMGIDWTTDRKHLAEAIPPAYTEFIGRRVLPKLTRRDIA